MKIDWSKGVSLHRLYGHDVFAIEANRHGKDEKFIIHVCSHLKCEEFRNVRLLVRTPRKPMWQQWLSLS